MNTTKKGPKFPRIMVSNDRHFALVLEAQSRGMTLLALCEEKFKKCGNYRLPAKK